MVSTRHHPREFPPPELSPRKNSRTSTTSPAPNSPTTSSPIADTKELAKRAVSNSFMASSTSTSAAPTSTSGWSHTVSNITIWWLYLSVPLQFWDTLYILLRPHTFKGGALQWPIWKPYEVYAALDYVYSPLAWEKNDGFGGAQGAINGIEVVLYGLYLRILLNHGLPNKGGRGLQAGEGVKGWLSGGRRVEGKIGNRAVIIGFAAAVMTLSKTVLYYFNEYFSAFDNIKHNDWITLVFLYIIMNGLWVVFPAYMTLTFGSDILEALDLASESSSAASKKKY
ncbi:hypothetical protein P154DRAFT_526888 [Amniculicola lignicola CBS 123094]|uniref:Uncharacterized protein n=1 Tax=Amniculicola lignicola CBS 123094 TaxID=1392246 RepID=A0A6A5VYD3_9PLEO|nr:hypothetical protein P154DRAFT_526888 [Amniculicola lignicola CBS 123094]